MIPIKLSLQNFLSYRENNLLDLTGVQVACLCGDNGHGKSALLDAMTWALWGWARGRRYGQGGSSADELIHQGQSEMEVSLEFYSNGTTYRVLRKFSRGSKTRSSATILDFQIAADGNFQSLTEGSITDTERRIQNLLGMDYDTFINSSFLLQGQADRFTSSTPARRKESLAEILRLSLFERLELQARKGLREHEKTLETKRATNKNLEESLSKEPEYLKALEMANQTLQELEPNIRSVAQILEAHKTQLHSLRLRRQETDRLHDAVNRAREDEKELMLQIQGIKERTDHYSNLLDKENEITVGVTDYYTRKDLLKTADSDRVKHEELTFKEFAVKNQISQQQASLNLQCTHLRNRVETELLPKVKRGGQIQKELTTITKLLHNFSRQESDLDNQREELLLMIGEIERLGAEISSLFSEMQELRMQLDVLNTGIDDCPLCKAPLNLEGFKNLKHSIEVKGRDLKTKYLTCQETYSPLEKQREKHDAAIKSLEAKLSSEKSSLSARQGTLQREFDDCNQANADLVLIKNEISQIEWEINNLQFSSQLHSQLSQLESEIVSLSYDETLHGTLKTEVQTLEFYVPLEHQMKEAKARYEEEKQSLSTLYKILESRREDQLKSITEIEKIKEELNELPLVETNLQSQELILEDLMRQRSYHETQASGHQTHLQDLEEAKARKSEISKTINCLEREVSTLTLLTEAFGKKGIQALLIEAALPELESEANQLLARLTDNRLSLTLETQRQNRRGETTETLEIQIGDELGTRSYELFSGGEAFRINFALRIALAKLLASRAGAPLKTLFLDEGFGTQDTEGRERLIQAIRSVQDDFDLILVITHIEELKEAFPVRIEVTKTDQVGSRFELTWA